MRERCRVKIYKYLSHSRLNALLEPCVLLMLLAWLFPCSLPADEPDVVVIDNGYMYFCEKGTEDNEAVRLHLLDIPASKTSAFYLQGSCRKGPPVFKESISFPMAWSVEKSVFSFLFSIVGTDPCGRFFFYIMRQPDMADGYDENDDMTSTRNPAIRKEDRTNDEVRSKHQKRFYSYKEESKKVDIQQVSFLDKSVAPLAFIFLVPQNDNIWYALSGNEILACFPMAADYSGTSPKDEMFWAPRPSAPKFRWMTCSVDTDVHHEIGFQMQDGTKPVFGTRVGNKHISINGRIFRKYPWMKWIVCFQKGDCYILRGLTKANTWKNLGVELRKCPTIVINNDSEYICIPAEVPMDKRDISLSMEAIADGLRRKGILKTYSPHGMSETAKEKLRLQEEEAKRQAELEEFRKRQSERNLKDAATPARQNPRNEPPPVPFLFSQEELKELLTGPSPENFTDPVERGLAYDWLGRYEEAKAELEKARGPRGRFELALFLKAGRPGIPAERDRANKLFQELADEMDDREDELTAEECLLAGRACWEIRPQKATQRSHWKEMGDDFLEQAIERGERSAYFYRAYYHHRVSGYKLEEFWKALPSDNPDVKAGIAWLAGSDLNLSERKNQKEHLQYLKEAIRAHSTLAQFYLGYLYQLQDFGPGQYIKHDKERAIFWLTRAMERGCVDARIVLSFLTLVPLEPPLELP